MPMESFHATTIVSVRRHGKVVQQRQEGFVRGSNDHGE